MALVVLGLVLMGLRWGGVAPFGDWSWWQPLLPFAGASLWWAWADRSGHTRRVQERKMRQRVDQRRQRALENLGMSERAARAKVAEKHSNKPRQP
ncbi:MAG: TIGR04438 family Trp-rich protein [Leptothrix sp. (in: b-proteobacteria)]